MGERGAGAPARPEYSGRFGVLAIRKIKELATRLIKAFDVRARSISVEAATLSGGNQQKLILARELEDEPDAADRRATDAWTRRRARSSSCGGGSSSRRRPGTAVLLISAELDEIYALSDRIVTIYEGRITGEYSPTRRPRQIGIGMTGGRTPAAAS